MSSIPKRKIPEFEIGKEQMETLKTIAAVTKVISEDEELANQIAKVFKRITEEKEKELVDEITKLLAERVKDASVEQIKGSFAYWYIFCFPTEMSRVWRIGWHT